MKLQKFLDEGPYKLVFAGYHLKDNVLDDMTVEELQEAVYSNIPNEKIDVRSVQREFESLLKTKIADAKFVAKKVIPELVKDLQSMVEGTLSWKPMLGGEQASKGGYTTKVFKRDDGYGYEIWKGSKRVAKSKKDTDQFDVKTQAEKALGAIKKK